MNEFKIVGLVVSYGTSNNQDWIDILANDKTITVYLEDLDLSTLERQLDGAHVFVKGYLQPFDDSDFPKVIATSLEVL